MDLPTIPFMSFFVKYIDQPNQTRLNKKSNQAEHISPQIWGGEKNMH